jgi:hypothetical protein
MEQTCTFFLNYPNFHNPKIVDNSNIIPICLHTIHHESLEIVG